MIRKAICAEEYLVTRGGEGEPRAATCHPLISKGAREAAVQVNLAFSVINNNQNNLRLGM